jgi:hypothetical protein
MSLIRSVQIPLGAWPEDTLRFGAAPVAWWLNAVAGASFGLIGPMQFSRSLRRRFGRVHRVAGRMFIGAGGVLGLSGIVLLARVPQISTPQISTGLMDVARAVFGLCLLVPLALSLAAIKSGDIVRHRAWAIRAYAIGMGSGTVALVFFPIYLIAGEPPSGLTADVIFVLWWASEWVVRRLSVASRPAFAMPVVPA